MQELLTGIILGLIQGITEWLPISSSGMLTLFSSNFLNSISLGKILQLALFLHLGTFLAALIYFRKDVSILLKTIPNYKRTSTENQKLLSFLFLSTLISGILGIIFLKLILKFENILQPTGKTITFIVGILLLITGIIQIKAKTKGQLQIKDLKKSDGILLGLMQGIAAFPGISRSGITVSILLLNNFDDTTALKLSFLMSLPIVLAGNILLNLEMFSFNLLNLTGLLFSFVFGILTIHTLMRLSKKINFGKFILIFAILMLLSTLI